MRARWLPVLLLGLAGVLPARARELWKSTDGSKVLEGHAFYKTYASELFLPQSLVDVTEAMKSLGVPNVAVVPKAVGLATQSLRGWGRFVDGPWELDAGWELSAVASTTAGLLPTASLSAVPSATAGPAASRRLVDFDPILYQAGGLTLAQNLDLLAVKRTLPFGTLTIGRQVLSWGTGAFWNPTDLLSPFAPTDIDREVRHGVDAARLAIALGAVSELDLLWLPQKKLRNQGGVARVVTNVHDFDVSVSLAKYMRDVVGGADFAGDLGPISIHGEAAWTEPLDSGAGFLRAVAGGQWMPTDKTTLLAEYYFNGFGATAASGYLTKMEDPRETSGQISGAGRHYLGLSASYAASDLVSISGSTLVNLQDPSAILVPLVEWWFEQSVIFRAGGFLSVGRGADAHVFDGLDAADVSANDAAFHSAVTTLGLRSEYGITPFGVFIEVGLYL